MLGVTGVLKLYSSGIFCALQQIAQTVSRTFFHLAAILCFSLCAECLTKRSLHISRERALDTAH